MCLCLFYDFKSGNAFALVSRVVVWPFVYSVLLHVNTSPPQKLFGLVLAFMLWATASDCLTIPSCTFEPFLLSSCTQVKEMSPLSSRPPCLFTPIPGKLARRTLWGKVSLNRTCELWQSDGAHRIDWLLHNRSKRSMLEPQSLFFKQTNRPGAWLAQECLVALIHWAQQLCKHHRMLSNNWY